MGLSKRPKHQRMPPYEHGSQPSRAYLWLRWQVAAIASSGVGVQGRMALPLHGVHLKKTDQNHCEISLMEDTDYSRSGTVEGRNAGPPCIVEWLMHKMAHHFMRRLLWSSPAHEMPLLTLRPLP